MADYNIPRDGATRTAKGSPVPGVKPPGPNDPVLPGKGNYDAIQKRIGGPATAPKAATKPQPTADTAALPKGD